MLAPVVDRLPADNDEGSGQPAQERRPLRNGNGMADTWTHWLIANYHLLLSMYAGLGVLAATLLAKAVAWCVPTMRAAAKLNRDTFKTKMQKPHYAENQHWNMRWAPVSLVVIYGLVMPFCVTIEPQSWWKVITDTVVILMFYDFFYYLTHRFLFHDGGFLGGPLMWCHAVHHRQHNPCRNDSSYIHPLEVAIGLGLYTASILVLSLIMGRFHVATIVVTWTAFSLINQHNHNLWEEDRFPFKYVAYVSKMHHNHHAKFTGGNYATISLLYDWLFGTLDDGKGQRRVLRQREAMAREAVPAE